MTSRNFSLCSIRTTGAVWRSQVLHSQPLHEFATQEWEKLKGEAGTCSITNYAQTT
ncbi:unnamed protein product [Amoebophrya sp. A120]|nr:unnamed protein product [Amoebophrya sp. A120]|eukprot:GSA120T00018270001.1